MSMVMEPTSQASVLPQPQQQPQLQKQQPSASSSPQPDSDSSQTQNEIGANLSAILNAAKNTSLNLVNNSDQTPPPTDTKPISSEKEAGDVQQKVFNRFTSSLNDLGFRSPFPINVLPPFLAVLQQNPLALHQQLLRMANEQSSGISPGEEEEETENSTTAEPEDLTVSEKRDGSDEPNGDNDICNQQNWSYEEQFKQLYELSDDVKRKEWLDDWLGFMHRIGKPVTRIPIMAKQVLDLYELYRLVVQHGGLVEIINKKLWREITKGLNLPSSITSAAFTLRTQYQKFLYDYECEKEGLSNPADLQQAIDGNRREGRRNTANNTDYSQLSYTLSHSNPSALLSKHLNGCIRPGLDDDPTLGPSASQQAAFVAAYRAEQLAAIEAHQRHLERAQRAAVEAVARRSVQASTSGRESTSSVDSEGCPAKRARTASVVGANLEDGLNPLSTQTVDRLFGAAPSAHLKITSRGDGRGVESSLVVSMEINGTMYQGVLFANLHTPVTESLAQCAGLNLVNSSKLGS
ncbi:hypothetical protein AB6A40_000259 [Gnathostoma spinigerum]|uniref:Uncharacterized protein n=1 Tax=Gnathostoma spinigerum TaxID=75299 RepID=A0ABD6E1R5_9BILA